MWKSLLALTSLVAAHTLVQALEPTAAEKQWLQASLPVLRFAHQQQMPLDVIVMLQPKPGASPVAMGMINKRCKLVFSIRDNPHAAQALAHLPDDLVNPVIELMAAHELGHCRRGLAGSWQKMPRDILAAEAHAETLAENNALQQQPPFMPPSVDAEQRAERREEGYGDLVGLAWTARQHPALYPRIHAWLLATREIDNTPGSSHDTMHWIKLAEQQEAFAPTSIFEAASVLWVSGLKQSQ